MSKTDNSKLSLAAIYAGGFKKWLAKRRWLGENLLLVVLIAVFALCLVAFILLHEYAQRLGGLTTELLNEAVTAVLIADTVGLFYELVARKSMTQETLKLVRQQLKGEMRSIKSLTALVKDTQKVRDCGLVDFGRTRQFLHEDILNHLSSIKTLKVMVIHGTRLWMNKEFNRAVLNSRDANVRVLLLKPDSAFVSMRAGEYPDEYDQKAMRAQIISSIKLLDKWKEKKGDCCQVKLYDSPPSFWLVIVDDVLYLSGYRKGKGSQDCEVFKLDNRKHSMYHVLDEYFERTWQQAAEPEDLDAPTQPDR